MFIRTSYSIVFLSTSDYFQISKGILAKERLSPGINDEMYNLKGILNVSIQVSIKNI